jgi:hypothetical protein
VLANQVTDGVDLVSSDYLPTDDVAGLVDRAVAAR